VRAALKEWQLGASVGTTLLFLLLGAVHLLMFLAYLMLLFER
jgi:hypothetical protein